MRIGIYKVKAVIWLHILRLWRYKFSFINNVFSIMLWITIFVLGALMFIPKEQMSYVAPITFWGIVMWNIMSNSVWFIGGWSWFFISQGFVEEHIIVNTKPSLVFAGRVLTGLSITLLASFTLYLIFSGMFGTDLLKIYNLEYLVLGLLCVLIISVSYSLILAAISFRIGVPGTAIDIVNFLILIIGGIIAPVSKLPEPIRVIAIMLPYSHPAELVRYGVAGINPILGIEGETIISPLIAVLFVILAITLFNNVEKRIRKHGVKAVGRM